MSTNGAAVPKPDDAAAAAAAQDSPTLYVVYGRQGHGLATYYYYDEAEAKRQLFTMSLNDLLVRCNSNGNGNGNGNSRCGDDDEDMPPSLEVFAKGKRANLTMVSATSTLNFAKLSNLPMTEVLKMVDLMKTTVK